MEYGGIKLEEFIKALSISVDYDDLLHRLKSNRSVFIFFYNFLMLNNNYISYENKMKLETINNGKVIEGNLRYRNGLYFKEMKELENKYLLDEELFEEVKKLDVYKTYPISNDEILEKARLLGFHITTIEELIDDARVKFLKELNVKCILKSALIGKVKDQPLFDISSSHLLYLAKSAGIDVLNI